MKSNTTYTVLGRIPELNYVLLRNDKTQKIEAWTPSRGIEPGAIRVQNMELEFVRPIRCAFRVHDTEFNRDNAMDDIGRIYIDYAPVNAEYQEIK